MKQLNTDKHNATWWPL